MRDPQTRTIGQTQYRVAPLGFGSGRRLFLDLSKALGPALASLATGGRPTPAQALSALSTAIQGVNDAALESWAETLGDVTQYSVDGGQKWPTLNKANREILFSGAILSFFEWLAFAVEVQFSDFFDLLKPAPGGSDPPASTPAS